MPFAIRGMFCTKCALDIERVLTQLDGVVAAQVNYATERATVVYDPARVTALKMVNAIRSIAYDTPFEHLTLHSEDLLYATSARTVEGMLGNVEGVVQVAADLIAGSITVDVIPGQGRRGDLERSLGGLRFRVVEVGSANTRMLFLLRCLILAIIDVPVLWSAGAHAGLFVSPISLHAPLVVVVLSLFALFGVALPFYRFAYDAALQGEFDASVILALLASAFAVASLPVGILLPNTWSTNIGFVAATTLTTGWFMMRAMSVWVFPHFWGLTGRANPVSAARAPIGVVSDGSRR